MLVLQDFEALRPNLLARTIETVQGGGMVCILLKTMSSLKQLYTLTMVVGPFVVANLRMYIQDIAQMLMVMWSLDSMSVSFYHSEHAVHV